MDASSSTSQEPRENTQDDGNALLLYNYYTSFCANKVVLALHEKKLKFKSQIVDLLRGEQFESWYMKLNPKAEVPVLKDGVKIIPDSNRIIDYLEDNFSNGDTPRLIPEKGSPQYQTMERMKDLLDKVPVELITYGCLLNPELTENVKMSPKELKVRTGRYSNHIAMMDEYAGKNKEFSDLYLAKKQSLLLRYAAAQDVSEVKKALDELGILLDALDKELASHKGDKEKWWLCGEKFTIADINLAILLNRLQVIGLWGRYFGNSEHGHVQDYFKRVQQRDSFRKTVNQSSGILRSLCCLGSKEKLLVSLGGAAVILGVAGLAAIALQRKK